MSVFTTSAWNFGHTINLSNGAINFSELGDPTEKLAEISIGSYTLGEFINVVATAMNAVGAQEYTVTLDRTTRFITITADNDFELLTSSGAQQAISAWSLMGFSTTSDFTGASTYTGDSASGLQYIPQFKLQRYVDFIDDQVANQATVNKSASGNNVEVVAFGQEQRMSCNIKYATDITPQNEIIDNPNGVGDLREFMLYATTKAPLEFLPDVDTPTTFVDCILERTANSRDGVGFKLREMYSTGMVGYFETGTLTFLRINF